MRVEGIATQREAAKLERGKVDCAKEKRLVLENRPSCRYACDKENPFSLAEINEVECIV
jgi:hypothetical protein